MKFSAIILAAGRGERMNLGYNKVLFKYFTKTVLEYTLDAFLRCSTLEKLILVINESDKTKIDEILKNYDDERIKVTLGGASRSESVLNGLNIFDGDYCLIHDAARMHITTPEINKVAEALESHDVVTLYHKTIDTIKLVEKESIKTLNRNALKAVTTPQGFNRKAVEILYDTLSKNRNCTYQDDLEPLENKGLDIYFLEETSSNEKFTTKQDIPEYLVGQSLDFHPLVAKRDLILGGIKIPYDKGLMGHSDGDAVYHAVCEAIIGALGMGDIGKIFPDNDDKYLGIDSAYFIAYARELLKKERYTIVNLDIIIYIQTPKLKDYKPLMEEKLANLLEVSKNVVNIKATTMEKCGAIGHSEGIASEAIVLLKKINN